MTRLVVTGLQIKEKKAGTFGLHPLQPIFYQAQPEYIFMEKKMDFRPKVTPLKQLIDFFKNENSHVS